MVNCKYLLKLRWGILRVLFFVFFCMLEIFKLNNNIKLNRKIIMKESYKICDRNFDFELGFFLKNRKGFVV